MWRVLYINMCMIVWRFHHIRPFACRSACLPARLHASLFLAVSWIHNLVILSSHYTHYHFSLFIGHKFYILCLSIAIASHVCVFFFRFFSFRYQFEVYKMGRNTKWKYPNWRILWNARTHKQMKDFVFLISVAGSSILQDQVFSHCQ